MSLDWLTSDEWRTKTLQSPSDEKLSKHSDQSYIDAIPEELQTSCIWDLIKVLLYIRY